MANAQHVSIPCAAEHVPTYKPMPTTAARVGTAAVSMAIVALAPARAQPAVKFVASLAPRRALIFNPILTTVACVVNLVELEATATMVFANALQRTVIPNVAILGFAVAILARPLALVSLAAAVS